MPAPLYRPTERPRRRPWGSAGAVTPNPGLPLDPVLIPFSWIAPVLVRIPTIAVTKAQVTQTGGSTAYSAASAALQKQYGTNTALVTLDTACDADQQNLATHLTTYRSTPRPRQPTMTFNLLDRTDAECLVILGVGLTRRARIVGAPAGTPPAALNFTVEGIRHTIAVEQRTVTWATAAPIGTSPMVRDSFNRTSTNSAGQADTGQIWANTGGAASKHNVTGGRLTHTLTTAEDAIADTLALAQADMEIYLGHSSPSATPVGNTPESDILLRVAGANQLAAGILWFTDGTAQVFLAQSLNGSSTFSSFVAVSGITASQGISRRIRASGSTFSMTAWKEGTVEPTTATVSLAASHLAPGSFIISSYGPTGMTFPLTMRYDDLSITVIGINSDGTPGPWFRLGQSVLGGNDRIPF